MRAAAPLPTNNSSSTGSQWSGVSASTVSMESMRSAISVLTVFFYPSALSPQPWPLALSPLFVCAFVILLQHIVTEVAVEIPPHAVDVVAIGLHVVELDEERRSLHAIVM